MFIHSPLRHVPRKAEIQRVTFRLRVRVWIPAFAGKTEENKAPYVPPFILILSSSKDEDDFHGLCGCPCFDRLSMRKGGRGS